MQALVEKMNGKPGDSINRVNFGKSNGYKQ
jgi:hypothetical protein